MDKGISKFKTNNFKASKLVNPNFIKYLCK